MKNTYLYIILFVMLLSCTQKKTTVLEKGELDFLIGDWERTNEKEGKQTFEHWKKITQYEYEGLGYTLQKKDTVFKEELRLFKKDSLWNLEVTGVNESPTVFTLTDKNSHSFTAENPTHDFPKKIQYSYFDDVLSASVSGDDFEISFIFWRVEEE